MTEIFFPIKMRRSQAFGNILIRDKQVNASPVSPKKRTKGDADYREALSSRFVNIDENCATCKYGIEPQGDMQPTCEIVKGTIEKRFVCRFYERGSRGS